MSLPNSASYKAGGTIAPSRCVKIDTSQDNAVVQCSAATDQSIGISKRSQRDAPGISGSDTTVAANSGDSVEVYGPGAIAPATSGAAVTRGSWVTSDGSGKVITATGATTRPVGMALESASGANIEIQVLVIPFTNTLP